MIEEVFKITHIIKFSFIARIVNIWNNLPISVVNVNSVNLFKTHLDKFWMHHDVKYDFTTNLIEIGNRFMCEISVD